MTKSEMGINKGDYQMNIEKQEDFESRFIKTNKDGSWDWKNIHFVDIIKWIDYYFEEKASNADGENRQVDADVIPKITEIIDKAIKNEETAIKMNRLTNNMRGTVNYCLVRLNAIKSELSNLSL